MSGYNCKLILELKVSYKTESDIDNIVEAIKAFLNQYLESKGIKVSENIINKSKDHFELIFLEEYPIMSFNVFFEKKDGVIKYLNIIDLVKASTELMLSNDFFNKFIESIKCQVDISQAVLLFDPVYESYEQLFKDLKLKSKEYDIVAYFLNSSESGPR